MLFKDDKAAREQHNAVRNNIGWYRWTHDLLDITGTDATGFLDLLYVNSIAKTPVGRSKYTTALSESGGIIDDVIVFHMGENHFWISTLYGPKLMKWIDERKGSLDVEYHDLTYEMDMFSVQGPNSRILLNRIMNKPVDELKFFAIQDNEVGDAVVRIHRSGFTGELGFEIYCEKKDTASIESALTAAGAECGAMKITILEVIVRSLPMEKGYVLRQDIFGLNPFEADLSWSVNMNKDFIGKEYTEKIVENGGKQQLVGLEFDVYNDITQGEIVYLNGIKVGHVTAMTYGYTVDKYIGYAVVDSAKVKIGSLVSIGSNKNPGKVVEKNWYDPDKKKAKEVV